MLTVGQLAERTGVPATTLRYYDALGLVVPRRLANGHRRYDDGDAERLHLVKLCRALGLSLEDVAAVLVPGDGARRQEVARRRLGELDRTLSQLRAVRAVLAHFAECRHGRGDEEECRRQVRAAWQDLAPPAEPPAAPRPA